MYAALKAFVVAPVTCYLLLAPVPVPVPLPVPVFILYIIEGLDRSKYYLFRV